MKLLHDIDKGWIFHSHAWYLLHDIINNIPPDTKTLLDFGGGSGIAGAIIKSVYPDISITVMDINSDYHEIWNKRGINGIVVSGDPTIPAESSSFDMVISSHVLEHIDNYTDIFDELIRVTKNRCIVVVPDGEVADPTHKHIFNRKLFEDLVVFNKYKFSSYIYPLYHNHINNLVGIIYKC